MDSAWDHPRIRGEHFSRRRGVRECWGASPHTRGAPAKTAQLGRRTGIIPAYAGSTSARWERSFSTKDHPRIRGEHGTAGALLTAATGSSPHTRGAPQPAGRRDDQHRIIPAYAGSTATRARSTPFKQDHHRIRGEHLSNIHGRHRRAGSSPHTRGARRRSRVDDIRPPDHPRIRGEHRHRCGRLVRCLGSSPHTRGAR